MPTFDFESPEGRKYTLTGPEGATPEQAFAVLQQHLAGQRDSMPSPPRAGSDSLDQFPIVKSAGDQAPKNSPASWGAIPLDQTPKNDPAAWGAIPLSPDKEPAREPEFGSDEYVKKLADKYGMSHDYVRGIVNSQTSEEGVKGFPILGGAPLQARSRIR
jgi:hypothetical protein